MLFHGVGQQVTWPLHGLRNVLGWFGAAAVLAVAGLAYFIWRVNPVFSVPKLKSAKAEIGPEINEEIIEEEIEEPKKEKQVKKEY